MREHCIAGASAHSFCSGDDEEDMDPESTIPPLSFSSTAYAFFSINDKTSLIHDKSLRSWYLTQL